jgi:hypothetical protein
MCFLIPASWAESFLLHVILRERIATPRCMKSKYFPLSGLKPRQPKNFFSRTGPAIRSDSELKTIDRAGVKERFFVGH